MGIFLFLFMASPLIKEQVLSDHNNYYEITSQRQIMALRDKALFRRVQSCKCILICGKKTVLARGLVVRGIYWRKFATSFAGSFLFTSQGAREGRPWLVQSCKCILICGKKTVLARGLVVRGIYWRKFATSFAGSFLFTSQGAREGRPWLGLVTCLPEKN